VSRKPLQPNNKKHPDEEDNCSVTSSYPLSSILSLNEFSFVHFLNFCHLCSSISFLYFIPWLCIVPQHLHGLLSPSQLLWQPLYLDAMNVLKSGRRYCLYLFVSFRVEVLFSFFLFLMQVLRLKHTWRWRLNGFIMFKSCSSIQS